MLRGVHERWSHPHPHACHSFTKYIKDSYPHIENVLHSEYTEYTKISNNFLNFPNLKIMILHFILNVGNQLYVSIVRYCLALFQRIEHDFFCDTDVLLRIYLWRGWYVNSLLRVAHTRTREDADVRDTVLKIYIFLVVRLHALIARMCWAFSFKR